MLDQSAAALESVALDTLVTTLGEIEDLWRAHIAVEEQHLTVAAIDRALAPAEQGELGRAVGEFAAQNSKPEELVLPFILPWKEKWMPMSALLIEPATL
ncbi:MAG TPA: hypothetical protein VFH73_14605 [Polyangia bacterium]|nr:hypothetical protein [Polyangia bacterium]